VLEDRTLPSLSGVPFTVNQDQDPTGNLQQSASAGDAIGDTLVAWTSEKLVVGTIFAEGIRARLFDEIGNYKSTEFTVQPGSLVRQMSEPAVAMDDNGDFVVTWTETDPGFIKTVWFRQGNVVTAGTSMLSTPTAIGRGAQSRVGMDSNGNFVVSFTDPDVGAVRVFRYRADGTFVREFTPSQNVSTPPQSATATELLFTPIVTVTVASTAGYHTGDTVVISGMTPAGYNGTFTISSVPTGTTFTYTDPTFGLGDGTGGTAQDLNAHPYALNSSIAVAPDGGFALAFQIVYHNPVNSNVILQQYDFDDALEHSQQFGSPDPHFGTQTHPSVAVDDLGNPVLVFQDFAFLDSTNQNLSAGEGLRYRDIDLASLIFIVTGDTTGDLTPAVAADPSYPPGHPNYVVAYKQATSTGGRQVWATEVTSTSATPTSTPIDMAQDSSTVGVSVNTEHRFLLTYTFDAGHIDGQFGQLGGLPGSPVFLSLGDHVLTATGDGSATNTITIQNLPVSGDLAVIVNNREFDLHWADAAGGVFLNGDRNRYTFTIHDISDDTAVTVNTGTNINLFDAVNVQNVDSGLDNFDGSLTVNGQGLDSLNVFDRPAGSNTYNLQGGLLTSPNLPNFSIRYSNMTDVSLKVDGQEPSHVNVKGPPIARFFAAIQTSATNSPEQSSVVLDFTAGSPIPAAGAASFVDAGGGTLSLVGNAFRRESAFVGGLTSAGMFGDMSVSNGTLPVYSLSYGNVTSITDPGSGLAAQSGSAGAIFTVNGTPVNGLSLSSGTGTSNVVNVQATTGPLSFTGHGSDTVNVGNAHRVQSIAGKVTLGENPGSIALTVDDSADTGTRKAVVVGASTLTGLAPATIAYSNLSRLTVRGGLGNDKVTLAGSLPKFPIIVSEAGGTNTLVGPNTTNTWLLNGVNSGTLNSPMVMFANFQNLLGGAMSDTFQFAPTGSLTGTINGGGGANTLDYSGDGGAAVTVNLQTGAATRIRAGAPGGFANIQGLFGSSSTADNLIGANAATTWNIVGSNIGTVNDTFAFVGVENLFGGNQSDTFNIEPGGMIGSIHGGKGDWLNYATWITPVTVNLTTGMATRVGGGAAGVVVGIPNVYGGRGNDNLTGGPTGGVLIGGAGNDRLTAGAGRTILIGGTGGATLVGGPADDLLISGTTDYDLNPTALAAILAEWQRTDIGYGQRITDLRAGTGLSGGNRLIWGTTVHDDGVADTLTGNGGLDWFFANLGPTGVLDHITDRNNGGAEQVN
jgi:hypothetical protein